MDWRVPHGRQQEKEQKSGFTFNSHLRKSMKCVVLNIR